MLKRCLPGLMYFLVATSLIAQQLRLMREHFQGLSNVIGVTCSSDGRVCANQYAADSVVTLTEAKTGRTLREIHAPIFLFSPVLALNRDGSLLAIGYGADPGALFGVWDVQTGDRLYQQARPFEQGIKQAVAAITFSDDGEQMALISSDGEAELWDTVHWRMLDSVDGFAGAPKMIAFTGDHQVVVFQGDGSAQQWKAGGKIQSSVSKPMPSPAEVPEVVQDTRFDAFSTSFELTTDDQLLIPGTPARVFDLRKGTLEQLPGAMSSADEFDASGKHAYSMWDWQRGSLLAPETLQPMSAQTWESYRALAVSPDGAFVAVKRGTKAAIISVADKTEREYEFGAKFDHLHFSSDGTALIATGDETPTMAIAVANGNPVWLPTLYARDTLRSDMRYALQVRSAGIAFYVRLFDVQRRHALYELPLDAADHPSFSPDGKLAAVALRSSGGIVVIDLATGQRVASLSGFPGGIVARMQFTADGRRLVASGLRSFIRVWDLATQREVLALSVQGMNWAAFTAGGEYDGSDGELQNFYWVRGDTTVSLNDAARDHHVAGLTAKVWAGQSMPKSADDCGSALNATGLPVPMLIPNAKLPVDTGTLTLELQVKGGPAGKLKVVGTRNGVPLTAAAAPDRSGQYSVEVHLENGDNRIALWAIDSTDRLSSEVILNREYVDQRKPRPEIVAQSPQNDLQAVGFSRDGSLMATAQGHAITLWDMRTKRQLRTILGQTNAVRNLEFGSSDETFASNAVGDDVRIWSTRTGNEVCRIPTLTGKQGLVVFAINPDGTLIAIADEYGGLVRVFQMAGCSELASYEGGSAMPAWTANRKLLLQGRTFGDTAHNEIFGVDLDGDSITHNKAVGEIQSLTALPSGSVLILMKDGQVQLQNSAGELQLFTLDPQCSDGRPRNHLDQILALPDGRAFFDYGTKECLYAPDLKTVETTWKDGYLASAAVSRDNRWLAMVDTLGKLTVYNRLVAANETLPLQPTYGAVTQLVFSPAGDVLATGRGHAGIGLPGGARLLFWDLATSTMIRSLPPIQPGMLGPTTNWLLSPGFSHIGDISIGGDIAMLPLSFTAERRQNGELTLTQFDMDQDHATQAKMPMPFSGMLLSLQGVRLSGNAAYALIAGPKPGEAETANVATNREIASFRAHAGMMTQAALSADGALVLTYGDGSDGNSVRLWKQDGTPVWWLEGVAAMTITPALGFSDDNKLIAIVAEGHIQVVNAAVGTVMKTLEMEPAEATAVAFSPDDRRLAVGTGDGLTHIFDLSTGAMLETLAAEKDGELAYTPEAFYTGTLSRSAELSFRLGAYVYPLQQFDLYYNRPDLLMQAMAPELLPLIRAYKLVHDKRLQELGLNEAAEAATDGLPELRVTVPTSTTVTTRDLALPLTARSVDGVPLSSINVRVNGIVDSVIELHGRRTFDGTLPITLSAGKNDVEITAVDTQHHRSLTEELTLQYTGSANPTLYVVSIGVSNYSSASMDLHFAAKDASDLAEYFRGLPAGDGRSNVFSKVVVTGPLTDADATRAEILKTREVLAQAGVDDTVVLFFAGHGILDDKLNFYFAPYDMDFAASANKGISIAEMDQLLAASHSRRRLLLVDACHSGELDKSSVASTAISSRPKSGARGTAVVMNPNAINAFELLRSLFVDLRENSGTQIISASRGEEVALETKDLHNGIFTRAVLDGLQEGAAGDGDGHVSVTQLLDFVSAKVEAISHGHQTPTRRQENIEQDFQIQ